MRRWPATRTGELAGALGRWAEVFAASARLAPGLLRPVPPVWCSWYAYHACVTQEDILDNLAAMDDRQVPAGVVQIDDGHQADPGDFLASPGRYDDLPGLVRAVRGAGKASRDLDRPDAGGLVKHAAGLVGSWSTLLAKRPGWVVRDWASGEPAFAGTVCGQRCTALDLTHPDAASYLASVLATMRERGIDCFKVDFACAGARGVATRTSPLRIAVRLHLQMQFRYNGDMSTTTVGFAVADEDQERLARLVEHFGAGNRSAYLRATLPVMESLARAERLRELQARNAERAAAAGQDYESLLAEIRRAYKGEARER